MSVGADLIDTQLASAEGEMNRNADVGDVAGFVNTLRRTYPRTCLSMLLVFIFVVAWCRIAIDSEVVGPLSVAFTLHDAASQLQERYIVGKPHFQERSYYIALNLINNEPILPQMRSQLLLLASALGIENVFISIYENGKKTFRQ
jgi:hypothetical protein